MGMTIAEKILARHAGLEKVGPGDIVTVKVDYAILLDLSFNGPYLKKSKKAVQ